jgi:hypothetical protein
MGALMFLVVVLITGVLAVGVGVVVPLVAGSRAKELRAAKQQNKVLTRTMRVIANGTSGNPALEAQIALDEAEGIYIKELN